MKKLGIQLSKDDVIWSGIYPGILEKQFVFLVGNLAQEFEHIDFGDEGTEGYKSVKALKESF